ncbi:MAG: pantoate--beta-alanine ligase [Frankiaceae bacterium]|nr:pantoate--beta-alanine ligase [Frankiaceae bacterium]
MEVVVARTRDELVRARAAMPGRVAVVMTMGALHEGHAALIRAARQAADSVLVTVFVNPLQFAPGEDLDRYPRTFDEDLQICEREGADVVFAPTEDVVYPQPALVRISAGPLGDVLEGAVRPGHFEGVLTVVCKLLQLTIPDVAVFGEKDAQQLALIKLMVRDLDLGVAILGVPTVREPDGLALSSRNRYLSADERLTALALSAALRAGVESAPDGPDAVLAAARGFLALVDGVDVDYVACVSEPEFADLAGSSYSGPARLLVAARVGATRLIDNVRVAIG